MTPTDEQAEELALAKVLGESLSTEDYVYADAEFPDEAVLDGEYELVRIARAILAAGYCRRNDTLDEAAQAVISTTFMIPADERVSNLIDDVQLAAVTAIRSLKDPQ